jgi:1,4-dihydroxy-2-naphthoate octaprenyltransferase
MARLKLTIWLRELRAPFFTASIVPVLVGTAAAFAATGTFQPMLFLLALSAIVCLHAGANMANDYFDHASGNDPLNTNPTAFSGGSRLIQQQLLSPRAVLTAALVALALGAAIGCVLVLLTKSVFILALGLAGLFGGYFYTAGPLRLGYRTAGELVIALLFGVLPVCGAYYLQTHRLAPAALWSGSLIGLLIFLVILVNEFPDADADRAAGKKTLVVLLGQKRAAHLYKTLLVAGYALAGLSLFVLSDAAVAAALYLLTLPIALVALKQLNRDIHTGGSTINRITILLHLAAGLMLTAGFLLSPLLP